MRLLSSGGSQMGVSQLLELGYASGDAAAALQESRGDAAAAALLLHDRLVGAWLA